MEIEAAMFALRKREGNAMKVRNHLTFGAHIRRFKRKLHFSWVVRGVDVLIMLGFSVVIGMFIGAGLMYLGRG